MGGDVGEGAGDGVDDGATGVDVGAGDGVDDGATGVDVGAGVFRTQFAHSSTTMDIQIKVVGELNLFFMVFVPKSLRSLYLILGFFRTHLKPRNNPRAGNNPSGTRQIPQNNQFISTSNHSFPKTRMATNVRIDTSMATSLDTAVIADLSQIVAEFPNNTAPAKNTPKNHFLLRVVVCPTWLYVECVRPVAGEDQELQAGN